MPTKKKITKRRRQKKTQIVVVVESPFDSKDTLFPDKVAEAKNALSKIDLNALY
jgi:hypothetical protein